MKAKNIFAIVVMLVVAAMFSGAVSAQTCEGTLSAPTKQVYVGTPFAISFFNGDINSTGYNVTLGLPPELTLTAASSPLQITGITPDTAYAWEVNSTAAGNYSFNVTVEGPGGVSCVLSFNGTVDVIVPVPDPTLQVFVSDMTTLTLGQTYTEQVTVWNMGPGISYNTQGVASTAAGQTVSPVSWNAGTIGNNSGVDDTDVMQFNITPVACGNGDIFRVTVTNHEDGEGNIMTPVVGSDSFDIIGTDVAFTTLTATSVQQGQDTQIDYAVQNIGLLDATAVTVQIYVDGTLETTRNLGPLLAGNSTSDSWTYSTAAKVVGNHNVTAVITGSAECTSANNQADAVFTVSSSSGPVCGNNVVESGEQCDGTDLNGQSCTSRGYTGGSLSCSGSCTFVTSSCTSNGGSGGSSSSSGGGGGSGGSSRIFWLVLTEEKPEVTLPLRRGDTVKYDWKGKTYSFIIRQVYADRMKLGVSESLSYKTYDMNTVQDYNLNIDETPEADLGVRPITKGSGEVDITWSLLNVDGNDKRLIEILPPGSIDRRETPVVDVGSSEESVPVESGPVEEVGEAVDNYAEGVLEFVEELDVKSKTPIWGGLLIALLIVVAGMGIYFYATKDKKE